MRLNGLTDADRIYPGQTLLVPARWLQGTPSPGVVSFVKGEVMVWPPDPAEGFRPRLDDPVPQGSRIQTEADSAIEVTFEDDASLLLRSHTALGLMVSERKGALHLIRRIFLEMGRSVNHVKQATGTESRMTIETPSAVALVRGTRFRVTTDTTGAMRTEVLDGVVRVANAAREVELTPGEGILATRDDPALMPRKLLPPPDLTEPQPLYRQFPLQFEFSPVPDAKGYRVMLARERQFKDVVREVVIEPQARMNIVGLEDGLYFLQARSLDAAGLEGLPSATVDVNLRVNPMPPYIRIDTGAEFRDPAVKLEWLKVNDAVSYHFQVAADVDFNTLVTEKSGFSATVHRTRPLDYGSYYFRIRSSAADGYQGIWSDPLTFTVVPPPPSPPLESPEVTNDDILIRWRHLGADVTYHVQVAHDDEFREILLDRQVAQPELSLPIPKKSGHYYVRTSSVDGQGYEGAFSQPQSFKIENPYLELFGIVLFFGLVLLL